MKAISDALAALKSGEGLKGQLMRGGVGSIAIKIASTGLNLVLAIVLARLLGAEGFGVYSFIFALVTILAIPAQMGLLNLVVRETAKAQVAERWDIIKKQCMVTSRARDLTWDRMTNRHLENTFPL